MTVDFDKPRDIKIKKINQIINELEINKALKQK